jgi:hypothetical protein
MPTVYILKCLDNKYYIGKTNRPVSERVNEHACGNGCDWTRFFPPISIDKIIHNVDEFDEDKYTKMYMKKYGIENVRGGSYTSIQLQHYKILALEDELSTAHNRCYQCHKSGHFAKNCDELYYLPEDIPRDFSKFCQRCGRVGHNITTCFANTHFNGEYL